MQKGLFFNAQGRVMEDTLKKSNIANTFLFFNLKLGTNGVNKDFLRLKKGNSGNSMALPDMRQMHTETAKYKSRVPIRKPISNVYL